MSKPDGRLATKTKKYNTALSNTKIMAISGGALTASITSQDAAQGNWAGTAITGKIRVFNILGEEVYTGNLKGDKTLIQLPNPTAGIYHLKLIAEKFIIDRKIAVE